MSSSIQQHLAAASEKYASNFTQGHLQAPPVKSYLIVTCMDSRIDTFNAFGIDLGDAHIIRNAGASTADALRSIVISQQFLGTKEILIVKHTRCGMQFLKNEVARNTLGDRLGPEAVAELDARGMHDFIGFGTLEDAVRDDVKLLQKSKLIGDKVIVSGWVYDVETGSTERIDCESGMDL